MGQFRETLVGHGSWLLQIYKWSFVRTVQIVIGFTHRFSLTKEEEETLSKNLNKFRDT